MSVEQALRRAIFSYHGNSANCLMSGGLDSSVVGYWAVPTYGIFATSQPRDKYN
ncbi:hypothetical protein [Marinomonas sp. 2405UD68-3]|uniref:hypothetical protein n=1 Tax=Marinomonas sp. 2405UD68-3 TaxID=3391835 RepID=UPI0039C92F5D